MAIVGTDIGTAKIYLEQGELVAIPTETVYGLAGNALDAGSVTKIFAVKNRPSFDPLIVHVSGFENARPYIKSFPSEAVQLANRFWPGPLTLLLEKTDLIPDLVTAGLPRVGLRCPDHPLTSFLLRELSFPLAAPSANPFGYISPTTAEHVQQQLGHDIPYILDGGPCQVGLESTVIGWENEVPVVYRKGGCPLDEIEKVTGPLRTAAHSTSQPQAPGQLTSHYAPRKPFMLGDIQTLIKTHANLRLGILSFTPQHYPHVAKHLVLSPSGDLKEAAQNLFAMLRALDDSDVDMVLAEMVPDIGLGMAINDRLIRAAVR